MTLGVFTRSAILALLFTLIATPTNAVTQGQTCKRPGQTSGNFTCKKAGKKLIWVKKSSTPLVKPQKPETPTPQPTPTIDPSRPKELDACATSNKLVIGYATNLKLVYLSCGPDNKLHPQNGAPEINQATGRPIVGPLGSMIHSVDYVAPPMITTTPRTSVSDAAVLAPIEQCKIPDAGIQNNIPNNPQRHFVSGFPMYPERAVLAKNPVIQFIPVDFSDLQGQRSPQIDYKPTIDFLKAYWEGMSTNSIELRIRIPNNYTRLPKTVTESDLAADFFKTGRPPTGTWDYVRAAIAATDKDIDFSDVDVIAVVPPIEVTRAQIAGFTAESAEPGGGFATNEKRMMNILVSAGPTSSEAFELLNWAHELGHNFGLTDIRNTVNVAKQDSSDLGVFDLMNSMIAPELLAWQRFILGILNDDQVRCVTATTASTHWLRPIEQKTTQPKLVVIPTDKYTAIAIESRRSYGFDSNLGSRNEGPIVYTIDTTVPYRYSTMKIVQSPSGTDTEWRRDAALLVGESVTVGGWKITNLESGDFGDVIKVEKV